jgi:aspartate/tyrosine/aromatic aminotransferase
MVFDHITPAAPDAILGLTEAFRKDSNPKKINLGVGVYMDDQGRTPILASVKLAEQAMLRVENTKSYLPISGSPDYGACVQELLMGKDPRAADSARARTAQTPGGTGGLRVGADLLRRFLPGATVWLSAPTWPNHRGVFSAAGFPIQEYPYYDAASRGLASDALLDALRKIPADDIVVLHVCCHNPTGVDLSREQWHAVAEIARERGWIPFLDFAYQGLGEGLEEDRAGVAAVLSAGVDFLAAGSFSKNFGLYNERVGALTVVARDSDAAEAAFSHVKTAVRVLYSNPPSHGGTIVSTILKDRDLRRLWENELASMRRRIATVRAQLAEQLGRGQSKVDFSFITRQHGMFSFSGLTDSQVAFLRERKGIYLVAGGRMNVAGINSKNIEYLCQSVVESLDH